MKRGVLLLDYFPLYCEDCTLRYGDRCVVTNLDVGDYVDYLEKYENCPIKEYDDGTETR